MSKLLRRRILFSGSLPDIVIDSLVNYSEPIICNNLTITSSGILYVTEHLKSIIIKASGTVTVNGEINANYMGFPGRASNPGLGYCDGGQDFGYPIGQFNHVNQTGGGAPATNRSSAYKSMLGLDSAVAGGFTAPYGPGTAGQNGGGGGGGSDGSAGFGGGTGAGGGGGTTGNGSYGDPRGGAGSTADFDVNLALFKAGQIDQIPLFGGSGGSWFSVGGNGGGNIQIYAQIITITGVLTARGADARHENGAPTSTSPGAGGGGCVMIKAESMTNTGNINVNGGIGITNATRILSGNGGTGLILLDTGA